MASSATRWVANVFEEDRVPHELVIRNGIVVDGTGREAFRADVAIDDGRITEVGAVTEKGRREMDAEGHVVTPGFIDGHTHMDAQVMWDPLGTCSCWHGVTTVVMGNCGFTLAPVRPDARDLVVRNIERAEDIAPEAMAQGIDWTWETFPQYLDAIDRRPKGINCAANVGHSALRAWTMGPRAFEDPASEDEVRTMQAVLRSALRAGAIGFTTSLNPSHQTTDDQPVASRLATWHEISSLVAVMGDEGTGIFQFANGAEAQSDDREVRADYYGRIRDLAVMTGVPVTFGTLPVRPGYRDKLACIDETVAAGGRMFGQTHSRGVSAVLSFRTRLPFDKLPEWQGVRRLPLDEQKRTLRDPGVRRRLVYAAHHGDYGVIAGGEPRRPDYKLLKVFDSPLPPYRSVGGVADERGVDPVELMIDLALETDFDQLFVQPFGTYLDEDVVELMRHPRTVMTFSDSGAHVSQIMDSSIQTHLLAYWVREREAFTLEEAVEMITRRPADAWGFTGRGVLREGYVADLNVFDPAVVRPAMPIVEHDLPGGAPRLKQTAVGFRATVVAGEIVLLDGEHTGALPGRLLRGPFTSRRPFASSA